MSSLQSKHFGRILVGSTTFIFKVEGESGLVGLSSSSKSKSPHTVISVYYILLLLLHQYLNYLLIKDAEFQKILKDLHPS